MRSSTCALVAAIGAVAVALTATALIASSTAWPPAVSPALAADEGRLPSACSGSDPTSGDLLSSRVISPTTILDCEKSTVALDVVVNCRSAPIHVVISLDNSGSMSGMPLKRAKDGAKRFVDAIGMADRPSVRVGVVSHGDPARGELYLTNDPEQVVGTIQGLRATFSGQQDNLGDSITKAHRMLQDGRRNAARPTLEFIVLYTDGGQTHPPELAQGPARIAKNDGVTIAAVCLPYIHAERPLCPHVARLASDAKYYEEAKGTSQVPEMFERLGVDFGDLAIASLTLTDTLPVGLQTSGSISPAPLQPIDPRKPRWTADGTSALAIRYDVSPSEVATYTIGAAHVGFVDSRQRAGSFVVPSGVLTVTGPCVPPTPTPTVAASESPSPLPTTTATEMPKPSPSATGEPEPIFLPITLREHCRPEHYRSDIALVLDTSSSMAGQKLADAKLAAVLFVGMIDLEPGRSQVAVVRYDREAEVVRELTRSRALIEAAIRGLRVRSGTHIDKGLRAALSELQSARHLERNAQVLILLTDGVQTGTPGEELRAGEEVRTAGVRVLTIGLGADVDAATLRSIAGADERYYFAPDSGDLARIYGEIARDLMCPGVELWGGR